MRIGSLPRVLLLVAPLAVLAALLLRSCGGDDRPSIVLVTLDTTRPDHLSCYGYGRPTSPSLDALAARGIALEGWAQAAETGPSLASTLTSRRAPVTGVRANAERLDDRLPTLATVASDAGYRTGAFVSTVLLRRDVCAFDRGFETYDDEMTDPCFGHDDAQRIAERTIDRALAWLDAEDADDGRPFLLWVHLYDPHGPYTPPERAARLDASLETARSAVIHNRPDAAPLPVASIPRYQRVGDSLDAVDYVNRYDHEIAYMDSHLGRLLDRLDLETTVVAVHADHGEALGEDDYWFRHGSLLHDAALRVPIILAGRGVKSATITTRRARNLDIVPTLTQLARLAGLPDAEGVDLATSDGRRFTIGEARKREIVRDATGIDTRWKMRYVEGHGRLDVTWWPGSGEHEVASDYFGGQVGRALEEMKAWLVEPEREATPEARPADVDDALRGLGYVADPEEDAEISRPSDGR